jgi:hypothetical protein
VKLFIGAVDTVTTETMVAISRDEAIEAYRTKTAYPKARAIISLERLSFLWPVPIVEQTHHHRALCYMSSYIE